MMPIRIRSMKDFFAGLLFISFGIAALYISRNYEMGMAARMGPGYSPFLIGSVLMALGLAIVVQSLWTEGGTMTSWAWRPLILVLGSVVLFGLTVDSFGLVVATVGLLFVGCLGGWEFRLREVILLVAILVTCGVIVFVHGLGLAFKVWPI